ncbi:MAG TPA: hypothetical protein VHX86_18325 [Tepidisphaeraceae bacterium]|nr:hypothetical protein [Tepidisphaeraceae bacterium]
MAEIVVNNPNIVVDADSEGEAEGRLGRRHQNRQTRSEPETTLLRQLRHIRRQIEETACSSTWAEDCLYRSAAYAPDFQCACPACRTLFPNRRHPRPVRESNYSLDCQVEAEEDPEFAEERARLRNDRPRFGSVFIGRAGAGGNA